MIEKDFGGILDISTILQQIKVMPISEVGMNQTSYFLLHDGLPFHDIWYFGRQTNW